MQKKIGFLWASQWPSGPGHHLPTEGGLRDAHDHHRDTAQRLQHLGALKDGRWWV